MSSYLETSLAFIESKEMRDYLREELPKKCWVADACADIVAFAPAPIEQKLPVLEQIDRETAQKSMDGENSPSDAACYAAACRAALEEQHNGSMESIFHLQGYYYYGEEGNFIYDSIFTEFNSALNHLRHLEKKAPEIYACKEANYTITKYVRNDEGRFCTYCEWHLAGSDAIWYFDFVHSDLKDWTPLFDLGGDCCTYLPVPFKPGDIILADCMPYAEPRRLLVTEIGDNCDCCCVGVLHFTEDGGLRSGAFKHNMFFGYGETSPVPWLYRARRWTEELPNEEEVFTVLSPLIRAKPELGMEVRDYVSSAKEAVSWPEVKAAFGL